ncbi:MAG: hypothetical protein Q4D37_06955 [Oscillospiraceae bacterium]|nr:hypothetical protein [Oscillospiraceae bacterium]
MLDVDLLAMLKIDLGITAKAYDERLMQYLQTAKAEITREGITLLETIEDDQLVVMYAAWSWRKRDTGEGMPRMLRHALNNRLFSEKMRTDANG